MRAVLHRRLWVGAGWLVIAHVVLLFAGVVLEHSLQLGDKPSVAAAALVGSSMVKNYTGGYLQFVGFLVFLVAAMLLARLLRGDGEVAAWLSSCVAASAVTYVAVTVATGFAAGSAALYDGHHGVALATVTTVNDIRNFGFFVSGGLVGLFVLSVAVAGRVADALPRWVFYTGIVVGVCCILAVPGARLGLTNVTNMMWFVWFTALGVAALGRGRRMPGVPVGAETAPA